MSPDGKRIAFASNRSGNLDIWVANLDGSGPRRLTSSPAQDTAPVWSPTGQEIAFTSSRSGTPQIYIMDSEGLNIRRSDHDRQLERRAGLESFQAVQ